MEIQTTRKADLCMNVWGVNRGSVAEELEKNYAGSLVRLGDQDWVELCSPSGILSIETSGIYIGNGSKCAVRAEALWTAVHVRRGMVVPAESVKKLSKHWDMYVSVILEVPGRARFSASSEHQSWRGDWLVSDVYADPETGLYCRLVPQKSKKRA